MLEKYSQKVLTNLLSRLESGYELPDFQPVEDTKSMEKILEKVADRLHNNYPYFHPLYAGQMLKPPHPIARAAYQLAMWINPNNHALDGGRASSEMEKEAVADLAAMLEWSQHLGHLTGGGTVANLEALWVASKEKPGTKIIASDQAHYTHQRMCEVLKIPFDKVTTDRQGRMNIKNLETLLKQGDVGTGVVTMGTTGLGMVDPLPDILRLQKKYGFRIHADAAYGGYFKLVATLPDEVKKAFDGLSRVDSLVIDPHKHGLQPYGCGCVLFRHPQVAQHYLHDSPYTYFTSEELHLGEISLECSRAGAAAVGLWATHQLLPPEKDGAFAKNLSQCRKAAVELADRIRKDDRLHLVNHPDLDIVVWLKKADSYSEINEATDQIFAAAAHENLHLSKIKLPANKIELPDVVANADHVACLRNCLMKPEHLAWIDEIWKRIDKAVDF